RARCAGERFFGASRAGWEIARRSRSLPRHAGTCAMTEGFEFQYPWALAFLALLPLYAFIRGRTGADGAVRFSSAELVRAVGGKIRSVAGRLFAFFRLLTVALRSEEHMF